MSDTATALTLLPHLPLTSRTTSLPPEKTMPDPAPPPVYIDGWTPPPVSQLPEWRNQQHALMDLPLSAITVRTSLNTGSASMAPVLGSDDRKAETIVKDEKERLQHAELYYVTADMTALALNVAQEPPLGPVAPHRIPSPYGFMVFEEPISSYLHPAEAMRHTPMHELIEHDLYVPIVACSWGPLDPAPLDLPMWERPANSAVVGAALGVTGKTRDRLMRHAGTWITLYTYTGSTYDTSDPHKPIGTGPDGKLITPSEMLELAGHKSPLSWDGEGFLAHGRKWDDPGHVMAQPYIGRALTVIYSAWLMMTDPRAKKLVEQEDEPRPRAGRKRDRREGIQGPSDVHIVKVHSRHRPAPEARAEDAAASDGRKPPQWSCRWPVRTHRRMQWYPSREEHEEITILPFIKGPADKPLRIRERVNVWDEQPPAAE